MALPAPEYIFSKNSIHNQYNLLYIEDDAFDTKRLSRMLSGQHAFLYHLDTADSMQVALGLLEKNNYDAIFLDLNLPDSAGVETVQEISKKTHETPIILVTGTNDIDIAVKAIQNGAQDYLVKEEINPKILIKSIHHSIQRQELVNQLKAARAREHELATHDPLTGLGNRSLLHKQLATQISNYHRSKSKLAVIFIDLDYFKTINDIHGHAVGDAVLVEVTQRLKSNLRESDFIARVGGDEFVCVISGMQHIINISNIVKNLLDSLRAPIQYQGYKLGVGASIGIAICPDDSISTDGLLKCADTAMYSAKENGRNNFAYFDKSVQLQASNRLLLEKCIEDSLEQELFDVYYQPIFIDNGVDRNVYRYQATLVWKNPDSATLSIDEVMKASLETGIRTKIDEFIIENTIQQQHAWLHQGLNAVPITVAVSSRTFLRDNFVENLTTLLVRKNAKDCSWLEIAVPERVFRSRAAVVDSHIQKLKTVNIKLGLTEFGQGLASLHYLGKNLLSSIRIDPAHVPNIAKSSDNRLLVSVISSLANFFVDEVIIEGVESEEQQNILGSLQCSLAHGSYYSHPLSASELQKSLSK